MHLIIMLQYIQVLEFSGIFLTLESYHICLMNQCVDLICIPLLTLSRSMIWLKLNLINTLASDKP